MGAPSVSALCAEMLPQVGYMYSSKSLVHDHEYLKMKNVLASAIRSHPPRFPLRSVLLRGVQGLLQEDDSR